MCNALPQATIPAEDVQAQFQAVAPAVAAYDPELPLSGAELDGKFLELVSPVIGDDPARTMLARLWSLESARSV